LFGFEYVAKASDEPVVVPADTLTCAAAAELALNGNTEEKIIKGYVTEIVEAWSSFKNVSFWMADAADGGQVFEAFRVNCETEAEAPIVGDLVWVKGNLTAYTKNGVTIAETTKGGSFGIIEAVERPIVEPAVNLGAKTIAEFLELAEGTEAKLNLADAKVLYSWTSNNGNNSTYVRDASGAICFNRTQLGLTTDEDLNGFVYVTRSSYNNLPQANVATVNETNTENLTHAAGEPAVAKEIALTEAADNLNDLVLLKNVAVTVDGTKYYATVGEDKVQIYNGFHLEDFNDLASFVSEEQNYDVKGIMVVYKTTYEIYPIAITAAETGNPYDLNGDGKVSTADIQVIINEMKKGESDQNKDYDLNGDGKISTADIQVIINEMKK